MCVLGIGPNRKPCILVAMTENNFYAARSPLAEKFSDDRPVGSSDNWCPRRRRHIYTTVIVFLALPLSGIVDGPVIVDVAAISRVGEAWPQSSLK